MMLLKETNSTVSWGRLLKTLLGSDVTLLLNMDLRKIKSSCLRSYKC